MGLCAKLILAQGEVLIPDGVSLWFWSSNRGTWEPRPRGATRHAAAQAPPPAPAPVINNYNINITNHNHLCMDEESVKRRRLGDIGGFFKKLS
jgi:hypothetical protein